MITLKIDKPNKCNGDYSIFVSFPYDMNIINTIRELPTRYWLNDTKEWEVPFKKLEDLINIFSDKYEIDVKTDYPQCFAEDEEIDIPNGFEFKTKPFNHQIDGFKYGLNHSKWLLGDEQGLGKTKEVIDLAIAEKLMQGCKHCLIVCGVNGLKWNWVNEVATHSNERAYILGQKVRKNGNVTIGSMADRLSDAENIQDIEEYFIITNVETLRDERVTSALSEQCKKGNIGMIAADEVHKMKNASSQQGKGFLKLGADKMIAMTGTPLMNHPLDLYIILKWLGYEKHSFYAFRNHHCIMGGFGGHEVIGYKNLDELQEQLNDIMLRRLKKDVLDLPEKTIIDEYVEMTPKQSKIYKEVLDDIKDNIDQIAIAPNPLAQLIRLRQATGFTGILSSTIQESAKLDRMEELVDDAVENGQKVVIFSNWTQMTSAIKQRLQNKYYCVMITGEVNTEARERAKEEFQNNPKCKVIIGTTGAMGTGLTLTSGNVMIFTDIPWTKALYDQATDRCHRIGQNENVTVYNLICKGTVDERINEIVQKKGMMADYLIDGNIIGNKRELIDYLLN